MSQTIFRGGKRTRHFWSTGNLLESVLSLEKIDIIKSIAGQIFIKKNNDKMKPISTYHYFDKAFTDELRGCNEDDETVGMNNQPGYNVQRFTFQVRAPSSVEVENKILESKKTLEQETGTCTMFIPWNTSPPSYEEVKGIKGIPIGTDVKKKYFRNIKQFDASEKKLYIRLALKFLTGELTPDFFDEIC